jgi:bifunctional NMN adenylyltransferase/nudix hydrolase
MAEYGIIIGRFQVPEMNAGYARVISYVRQRHELITIVLGESALPGSKVNPLSVESRKAMIAEKYAEINIVSVKDHPLDETWSENLDQILLKLYPSTRLTLYGSDGGFVKRYSGQFKTDALPDYTESVQITEKATSQPFREGMVFAFSERMYPKVYATVDIAVFRNNKKEIMLGRKASDKKWRLIGGFSDPDDSGFEEAAKRELREEVGDIAFSELVYEGSFKIDDWRYRYEVDKIITTLFSTNFRSGVAEASDDIEALDWFPFEQIGEMIEKGQTAPEHKPLLHFLMKKYAE